VAVAGVAGGAAVYWQWLRPGSGVVEVEDSDEDLAAPVTPDPGYLGPHACAPCHAKRVAEFEATSHFRACRLPRAGEMPAGFAPGKGTHATHDPALRFEMTFSGGEFLQTAIHASPGGRPRRSTARIDLVYGAAKADEVFFSWRGDRLYELPVVWLHPQNRWANATYSRFGSGDFSREATTRCLECHNTWLEHVPGTRNQYKRDHMVLGVTCERCHGPGREHVAFHQMHPEADVGHAVVHPRRLKRDRQLDVCTQCHSNATRGRGPAFSYRPGEPLEASFRVAVSKHPENDHVANQVKYLRQSKCFQKDATLSCTTCHNPHAAHGSVESARVRRSCLKCHKPAACTEQHRLPQAVRSNCVGCHMPQRVWMNVHFHTDNDRYVPPIRRYQHRIAVYPIARQEVLLAWYRTRSDAHSRAEAERLTAALVKYWLAEAENLRREYRFLAAIGAVREALRLDSAPSTRDKLQEMVAIQARLDADLVTALQEIETKRIPQAIQTLEAMLRIKPDLAVAHGKLGTCYAITGQTQLAREHLEAVARADPDDPYGDMMLGWLAYLAGKPAEAVQAYRRADDVEPFNAKTHYHWGLALAALERWEEASEHYQRVLTIDPNHAGSSQALSLALRRQGQPAKALPYALRAARLTRFENADVLLTLADAYAEQGRFNKAELTARQALACAASSNLELRALIRRRLQEIRSLRGRQKEKGKRNK
jgi:tetratricopeptide (TPR) repeat protein